MSQKLVTYVAVVEIDGERHVLKGTGVPHNTTVKNHLQQIHPEMKIISFEKADPKNPIAHIERVKKELDEKFPDREPLTPERLNESANRAIEEQNAAKVG